MALQKIHAPPTLLLSVALGTIAGGCGEHHVGTPPFDVSPGNVEMAWLRGVGTGPAQTRVVCGRGLDDPISRALCRTPLPELGGLRDLYRVLDLSVGNNARAAVTTHSLGLSARSVSALNPRVIVFRNYSPVLEEDQIAAVAFSRGESFVELVGYDPTANDFHLYLLAFQPACRTSDDSHAGRLPACTPRDLLTERIETGWTGWTLYEERDLEDTPLDCSSCHRPDGAAAPGRLLMRQASGPWMHWGDFHGVASSLTCPDETGRATQVSGEIPADGADLLLEVDGPEGRHAGIPVSELIAAPSGYDLSSFLFYVAGQADGAGDVPCEPPECPFSEPLPFPSQEVLCDELREGRADVAGGAWDRYRAEVLGRGFPVPHFAPDILSPTTRAAVTSDFARFVDESAPASGNAFSALSGLIDPEVARAIGFVPDPADSAVTLLGKMCARCHDDATDLRLARSRFNAVSLESLDQATANEIRRRISLPETSPERMPPLRAGELPAWAIDRISEFLTATLDQ